MPHLNERCEVRRTPTTGSEQCTAGGYYENAPAEELLCDSPVRSSQREGVATWELVLVGVVEENLLPARCITVLKNEKQWKHNRKALS